MKPPRLSSFAFCISLVFPALLSAGTVADGDVTVKNQLALQQAMRTARQHLVDANPRLAVETLEAQLAKVGGHSSYLALMREAYRAYITHLWLLNQPDHAQRYLERLCVLEPAAAADPTLRPPEIVEKGGPEPKVAVTAPAPAASGPKWPKFTKLPTPPAKEADALKPTVRAHAESPGPSVDPFDASLHRPDPERESRLKAAQMMLARAEDQFTKRKFAEARVLYEQAYQADRDALLPSKDNYAFCVLDQVVVDLNRPGVGAEQLTAMRKQVEGALALGPTASVAGVGEGLLREIDQRKKGKVGAGGAGEAPAVSIQHVGRNKEGWNVTETPHFLIFHHQGPELAEKVARIAEGTRLAMYRKWFGVDGVAWAPKCELILHATGADYHKMTGVAATSPGHSRIETDPGTKRVVARRLDLRLDHAGFLEAVLPHETTHVVLAGMFEGHQVPRWADEGIAVLSEPEEKVQQHRRNLTQAASLRQLFGLKELMELNNYPDGRKISAFYAQSVALVDFLSREKGPTVLSQFIRDGLRDGYEKALERHYKLDFRGLEERWQEYLSSGAVAAR